MSTGGTSMAQTSRHSNEQPIIRNLSIMASAGSGKTYQLSSRFLQLVYLGAEPGSILASTFTRVAAGEIRDRILQRLAEAAQDDKARRELASALGVKRLSREDVIAGLLRLTRNLHRLHIRTLDSFFAQVVRCFALELGIDPAAQVVDADLDNDMRREAIEMMLDERDPQPLIELLRVITEGAESRRVTEVIDEEMRVMYEVYREAPPEAWEHVQPWKLLDSEELEAAITHLSNTPPGSNGHHVNAHRDDCTRVREAMLLGCGGWVAFLAKGLACAIVAKDGVYYRKAVESDVASAYEPLLKHARAVIRNTIVARTRSTRALLEQLHRRYEESKARHKAMTFADVTAKMAQVMAPPHSHESGIATANDICFRLDSTLRHIMLDEMQDTSVQQWRSLTEIVRNTISEPPPDRSFFCVGDVKQSIYGWREANPEILAQMPNLLRDLGGEVEHETLPQNWRSSRIVLETVDRVFTDMRPYNVLEALPAEVHEWAGEYERHEPKRDLPGYAELRTARLADRAAGERQTQVRLEDTAELIERLHRASPDCSIGVLTRKNDTVSCLLYELGPSRRNLNAAGRGGGSLTDAAAVNAVLDLLRLADHPEHTVAAFNVLHSPLGEAIDFTDINQRVRVARDVRRLLIDHGYANTIGMWIERIGSRCDARELRRLMQLQQLAGRFDARATLRTSDFLALVEVTVIPDSGAAPIQVMTIHQAKGLEFDIVVLPDLDQAIARASKLKVIVERDPCGNITRVARHMSKDAWALFDDLSPMYDQQITRIARDSLCSLYVAMTRAKHALHMIVNPSSEKEKTIPKTLAGVLRCAFVGDGQIDAEQVLYTHGDPDWNVSAKASSSQPKAKSQQPKAKSQKPITITLAAATGTIPRGRKAASASELGETEHAREWTADFTLRMPNQEARDRGTAIHAMFETIEWIDDDTPDREELLRIAMGIAPRRGEQWAREQVDAFVGMIEQPQVRQALAGRPPDAMLWREVPFARLVDGAIRSGIIDRLVAHFDDTGRCTRATVIDYKTDRIDVSAVKERAAHHRPQLEAYRAAAAAMLNIEPAHISMRLIFTECGCVEEL